MNVLMVVNNRGFDDCRVANYARSFVRNGANVEVHGICKNIKTTEVKNIDGVKYKIGPFDYSRFSLLSINFNRDKFLKRTLLADKSHAITKKEIKIAPYLATINRLKSAALWVSRKIIVRYFHPSISILGVDALLWSYFKSLCAITPDSVNYDVVVAHELWGLEAGYFLAKYYNAKLIYDSHELELHRYSNWSRRSHIRKTEYENKYIKSAHYTTTVSQGCASHIKKHYNIDEDRISVIYNTRMSRNINLDISPTIKDSATKPNSAKIIVYTGSVTNNRGIETIIQALPGIDVNFEFILLGKIDINFKPTLDKLISNSTAKDRIKFLNPVHYDDVIGFISTANIAVVPIVDACLSYRYCMPNKLFEAAFAGLPIVASNLPDMKRFIEMHKLGMTYNPECPISLISAINSISSILQSSNTQKNKEIIEEYCFEKSIHNTFFKNKKILGTLDNAK